MSEFKITITEFFRNEYSRMISYVSYYLSDEGYENSDDVVQEVMLNIYGLPDFTIPLNELSAYVYRSLKNRIIDMSRRKKDKKNISLSHDIGSEMTLMDILHDMRYDAAEQSEKDDMRKVFYDALDSLNEKDRAVVIMTEFEGRSFREISSMMDVPVGTLLARKSRAFKKIRKFLQHKYGNVLIEM